MNQVHRIIKHFVNSFNLDRINRIDSITTTSIAMIINLDHTKFIKQISRMTTILFKTVRTRTKIRFMIKIFTTMISMKTMKLETRKIIMISMFTLYHLSESLIIHAFDATQSLHFATNFLSIYMMNVE